ncbi:MAG TPA: hypothetical protein VLH81_03575 [Desulfobacterales bacterium]|nr:hypothetical protein [Desulfobacterales bacterium]
MAAFNKFNCFAGDLAKGIHQLQAAGHTLKVLLTNTAPVATNSVKADLTEITAQNGYPAGGSDIQNDLSITTNVATLTGTDVVFTASGGSFGPWRYAVLYNDTPTSPADPLIGWWDYGSSVTTQIGETVTIDFGASIYTVTC